MQPNKKISIVSLIYKSKKFADAVYESVHKYTPELANGNCEFFFIANDATPTLIKHLTNPNEPCSKYYRQCKI